MPRIIHVTDYRCEERPTLMAATPWIGSQRSAFDLRHICVITETYPPEVNGVAFTLAHLVDGLSARGHAVSVVRPHQQASDRPDCRCGPNVTLVPSLPFPWYKELQIGIPAGGYCGAAGDSIVQMWCMSPRRAL